MPNEQQGKSRTTIKRALQPFYLTDYLWRLEIASVLTSWCEMKINSLQILTFCLRDEIVIELTPAEIL